LQVTDFDSLDRKPIASRSRSYGDRVTRAKVIPDRTNAALGAAKHRGREAGVEGYRARAKLTAKAQTKKTLPDDSQPTGEQHNAAAGRISVD
jgi:hypothetical protein